MSPKFDLEKTQKLADLFSVTKEKRDGLWREQFFKAVPDASMRGSNSQVFQGPDGFPYFFLALPPAARPFTPFCVTHILGFCVQNGVGAAVFGNDEGNPEWVFSYGDLFSYKSYGTFEGDPSDEVAEGKPEWKETIPKQRQIFTGAPSAEIFPPEARRVVKGFLEGNGVAKPAVALMVDPALKPSRNLVFNFFVDDFKTEENYRQMMGRLSWFLPRRRGVLGLERKTVQNWKFDAL